MLSEEEKKAIENLNIFANTFYGSFSMNEAKTVLNLITKLQKENEEKDKQIEKDRELKQRLCKEVNQIYAETEEKDRKIKRLNNTNKSYKGIINKQNKQIDLMVRYLASLDIEEDICVKTGRLNECDGIALGECEDCIKQYFAKLAKKGE